MGKKGCSKIQNTKLNTYDWLCDVPDAENATVSYEEPAGSEIVAAEKNNTVLIVCVALAVAAAAAVAVVVVVKKKKAK